MENEVLPVFRDYIDYLVSGGQLEYMRRSKTKPTVKVPGTQYWWGEDRTGFHDFCWHGPEAYSGLLPPLFSERYPDWQTVLLFAQSYERRLESDSWDDAKRAAYSITPEWVKKIDEIKSLCDDQRWSEAAILYLELSNDQGHSTSDPN